MSTLGDPLSDLALLLVYWTRPNDVLKRVPLVDGVTDHEGFLDRRELVEAYAARVAGTSITSMRASRCRVSSWR